MRMGGRRLAVRDRCRSRRAAGPADHRGRCGLARAAYLRGVAGARRRGDHRDAGDDRRAGRRIEADERGGRRRWSISAAASASPISRATCALDVEAIGEALAGQVDARRRLAYAIELGRWLVGGGGRLSDARGRPEGEPRRDLPRHRWRAAPPARRLGQFRHGGAAQLSGRGRRTLRRCAGPKTVSVVGCLCTPLDRLADDVASAARRCGRRDRGVHGGGLWRARRRPLPFWDTRRRSRCPFRTGIL